MFTTVLFSLFYLKVGDATVLVNADSINCPICLGSYRQPRILPCGHSFCKSCLEKQIQVSSRENVSNKVELACPKCKQETNIPNGGIEDFPLNKTLARQLDEARYIQKRKQVKHEFHKMCMCCKNEYFRILSEIQPIFMSLNNPDESISDGVCVVFVGEEGSVCVYICILGAVKHKYKVFFFNLFLLIYTSF